MKRHQADLLEWFPSRVKEGQAMLENLEMELYLVVGL